MQYDQARLVKGNWQARCFFQVYVVSNIGPAELESRSSLVTWVVWLRGGSGFLARARDALASRDPPPPDCVRARHELALARKASRAARLRRALFSRVSRPEPDDATAI